MINGETIGNKREGVAQVVGHWRIVVEVADGKRGSGARRKTAVNMICFVLNNNR
jgi:hypothetical protein